MDTTTSLRVVSKVAFTHSTIVGTITNGHYSGRVFCCVCIIVYTIAWGGAIIMDYSKKPSPLKEGMIATQKVKIYHIATQNADKNLSLNTQVSTW